MCDGCEENPIIGVRYKSSVCKNYDLCGACEDRLGHEHPMIKIKTPGGAPKVLLTCLNDEDVRKERRHGKCKEKGQGRRFMEKGLNKLFG